MTASTPGAGLGLKPAHFDDALQARAPGLWFEVHAENYMVDGGPRIAWLERVRARHPVSLHGVGLSLGGTQLPDPEHMSRLATLAGRIEPVLVSEHLAWNAVDGICLPDLLPVVRTGESLARIVRHVGELQDRLRRRVAIENPSHYLRIDGHEWDECEFLAELARRSGCGLLLDVNNVAVSSHNLGYDAQDYIARFPLDAVMEIHLAGHTQDPQLGADLLIDSHDAPVAPEVWALYEDAVRRAGPRPTLIERDAELPEFDVLMQERSRAASMLEGVAEEVMS
ncbi:DUF692 domain-containing protein [Variovorax sp. VNK109]|jgi:uncharacterized protein (UPF0276 family)|uniref:MNIO family bufferin maturase n=1 Tax=Variovorax sp. VNK109 TaxID=3400919 RepID=UPI003C03A32C